MAKKQNHYKNVGVVILALVLLVTFLKHKFAWNHNYYLFAVLVFGLVLYSSETLAKKFSKAWMRFGSFLGGINAKILLSVFFVFILLPTGFLKKLFGKKESTSESLWTHEGKDDVKFKNPW